MVDVCLGGLRAEAKKSDIPTDVAVILPDLADPRVDFTIVVEECGEVNSYYFPALHRITLCKELLALDHALVRFVLAHEIGHAFIMQLDIPFTGSHEAAADEFAMITEIAAGRAADLDKAAEHYLRAAEEGQVPPWDEHPTDLQRYWRLHCAAGEALKERRMLCDTGFVKRAARTWVRLLS